MKSYDVAIAGGGPAGSAAAIMLARSGHRVLLADGAPTGRFRIGEGLPPAAHPLLRDLGILQRFLSDGHRQSFGNLCAWGSDDPKPTDFIYDRHGHGFQLDRRRFDASLRAAAVESGAVVHAPARLSVIGPCRELPNGRTIQLARDDQRCEFSCRWLVDASGRSASLARGLGGVRHRKDRLAGVSMLLSAATNSQTDADARTLVEASEDGWWYSALLPSGHRLVAYLTDLDLVDHQAVRGDGMLWSRLLATRMLAEVCARHGYAPVGPTRMTDASTGWLESSAGPDWIAVGDAALSFDPLSSQGIATALHTGIKGACAIESALNGDGDRVSEYAAHVAAIHEVYLQHRRTFYSMERRWPNSEFWRRRHSIPEFHAPEHPRMA